MRPSKTAGVLKVSSAKSFCAKTSNLSPDFSLFAGIPSRGVIVSAAGDSERVKAEKLVTAVRELNNALEIPVTLEALSAADIPDLVKEAAAEGRTYSVPTVLSREQIASILSKLLA